ncbi:hypothetical protein OSB04_un000469 [Centaurea solstitialis]|uniref:CCHC-type domain-containing protein n=1 Tax=Centaurea solstitialis TaxID=347529 RepID=A0AA38SHC9_9ASTR|nr:hypothetical protein OSB04_un000469 [Centaurea solstitialis]
MSKSLQLDADLSGKPVDQKTYWAIIGSLLYLTASRPDIVFSTGVYARYQCDPRDSHLTIDKRILRYLKGTPDFGLWYPKDSGFELIAYTGSDHAGCKLNRKSTSGACQFLGDKLVLWMKTQLADFGYTMQRIPIYCDSKSAIHITLADLFTKPFVEKRHFFLLSKLGMLDLPPEIRTRAKSSIEITQLISEEKYQVLSDPTKNMKNTRQTPEPQTASRPCWVQNRIVSEITMNFRSFSSSTKMSIDLLSMASKLKPPVLQIGEYPQWHVRMIQFLNNIDKTLMVSIQEGPIKPYIDIPGTPETATTPAIEPRRVFILFQHYNELEKIRAELDDKALTFLTMAIPNDLFNRVDSRNTAKELWDELEKQFQGRERSIQAKLNQAIGAYEGFKALEGETLADSYSRFNIILNDLKRNGMHKSTSEINFKFLKNLNPEWDHYSMNKNLAEEDLHDLYSILSQHEVKVKDIVTKQKSITDSLALLTEKNKSVFSSTSSKKKSHSKALVTELSNSDSELKMKRVADNLTLLSSSIHKRYGKKKFYSKPKFDNYKRDKYMPKEYEKRPERKSYEKGKTDEKGNVCFNCDKPGHFVKDCKVPKVRDFDYYTTKAQHAKHNSEGKVLMAEEEWWYDDTSDDEDSAHFTQVHYNLMASVEETINLHKETKVSNEVSQTLSNSDMSDNDESSLEEKLLILKTEFDDLKEKIKFERARVIEFSNECALYKCLADDRELEKAEIRKEKAKLESQISEMKSALVNLESEKAKYMIKYEVCFQDGSEAYAKIKQLEDLNYKRGQTQQTLKLLTNNPKDTRFYNPKMGVGLPVIDVLKKAPKDSITTRKNNFDFTCDFQYDDLNQSYKTRKPVFSHTQCVSLYSQEKKSISNESEYFPKEKKGESETTESAPKSDEKTSDLETEKDCEIFSDFIQVNNFSENKCSSDYESDSDFDETKPCFDSDNDDDIEAGVEEEKINFISNPCLSLKILHLVLIMVSLREKFRQEPKSPENCPKKPVPAQSHPKT